MIGNRGGPGGSVAARPELRRDLGVMKIRKHDKIKQKRRNRAFPKMMSICTFLKYWIIIYICTFIVDKNRVMDPNNTMFSRVPLHYKMSKNQFSVKLSLCCE